MSSDGEVDCVPALPSGSSAPIRRCNNANDENGGPDNIAALTDLEHIESLARFCRRILARNNQP